VCPGEVFDVTPYAKTVAYHFLRNPLNQSLPRKFKIAFSGCRHDCALTPIHDVGLLATKNNEGVIGFRMSVGGGLGSTPRLAHLLREFVPMEELIPSIEAVIKVFDNLGNRKNRSKARMKFVLDKLGIEEFKKRWEEAYHTLQEAGPTRPSLTLLPAHDDPPLIMPERPKALPDVHSNGTTSNGKGHVSPEMESLPASFVTWRSANVLSQRQPGFVAAKIKLPSGDLTADQLLALADLADTYSNGNLRTNIDQNMIIRWIPEIKIHEFYDELAAHGLGTAGAEKVEDIVACPGTDTCGLGITSSKGLARALSELFPPGETPEDLKGVTVKISGCHNSCAQHHLATFGFHGVGKRIADHVAPVYELHVGGQVNGTATIAQLIVKVPAKNVPAAVRHILDLYRQDRQSGESLPAFLKRTGKAKLKTELIPHTMLPTFEEDPSYFYDWEGEKEFSVEDLGPGECAGGALEIIDNRMLEAEQGLYQAKLLAEKHQYGMAVNKTYRAIVSGTKAILVTEGIDPNTDADTLAEFDQLIIRKGVMPAAYQNLASQFGDLGSKDASAEFTQGKLDFARRFLEACQTATEQISRNLKLAPIEEKKDHQPEPPATQEAIPDSEHTLERPQAPVLDLRGVMCPLNYVKTKLKLEMMEDGEALEVWLDAGDPIKNVPMSLRNDGHKIMAEEPLDPTKAHFKLLVEKGEG